MEQKFYRNPEWWLASERHLAGLVLSREAFRRAVILLLALLALAGLLLWQRTLSVKVAYQVATLRAGRDQLLSQNRALAQRLETLRSMAHAEKVARERLGMQNADPARVIYLEEPVSEGLWARMRRVFKP